MALLFRCQSSNQYLVEQKVAGQVSLSQKNSLRSTILDMFLLSSLVCATQRLFLQKVTMFLIALNYWQKDSFQICSKGSD